MAVGARRNGMNPRTSRDRESRDLALNRLGTLAAAARETGVKHSTIGRRLSSLERSLGAPLVLRGPDGLTLTALGKEVAPLAEEVERAVLAFREVVQSQRERVRLAVPSGFTGLIPASPGCCRHSEFGERHAESRSAQAMASVSARTVCGLQGFACPIPVVGLLGNAMILARRASKVDAKNRIGGRAVEGTDLENRQGRKSFVGSNHTLPPTL